ncbi:hypothetical protein LOTGIDRAFT_229116 [Lottia gigantea]|uniref:H/ACA ribonucleoprotein complex non-core subunit NAF1 n=1 Tax=Lottia gigantea TaxID=225164 RepID=V4BKU7_LOTGI|nr:hypothetical protein LOTGIDRAFT_229116 [Lottia gigantea]ESO89224.1 hypothetical protein LOTGIDRAFT_229116 [Lottia gigantea]
MSSTCEEKEIKVDLINVNEEETASDKSQPNIENKTPVVSGAALDSATVDEANVSAENQTTVESGALDVKHESINSDASGNKTESESSLKNEESASVSEQSTGQDDIKKIKEKDTTERDVLCNDDTKMDTSLETVIKTEMAADVQTIDTDDSKITKTNQVMSDVVIKVEPIDYDEQPIMSRDGVEILKTENLMSYRQIKTEKDDHDSGTENDSGDDSSVVFSDAPVVPSDDESGVLSKGFTPKEVPRTKGELLPEDLPPLDELKINLAKDEKLLLIGQVSGIVNTLVVIQSLPDTPALNEDSVFFYEDRKVFGQVFETFGPVSKPFYSIRFNTIEDIKNKKINIGDKVYCAPNLEDITQYIFLDQLRQIKGSDASWKDNNEPPERCLDYSDDESERRSKSKRKGEKEIKEEDEESYLDALPGAMGQRSSKPQRRRRQKKHQNDRDRPAPDSFPPANNNQDMWNCWPPRGPCPRFTPPSNQMNFRQPPPSAPWHQSQQGQGHPWQQPSMNQRYFNPQHNFHYQNLPHMNRMPFGNGNPSNQGNPNLFMNNLPNTGGQINRFTYSQNQNNFISGPNQNNLFQPGSQNSGAPQIVDTRFIQNNQPIHNPYHTGIPK